jgi:hypothetical protein
MSKNIIMGEEKWVYDYDVERKTTLKKGFQKHQSELKNQGKFSLR